jgi:uncharacterized protein (TIRG00374 family)
LLKSRGFWIGILASAALIGLFFYGERDNLGRIDDAFRDANYFLIALALPVYFAGLWMRTIRWQYLLRPVRRVSALRLYPVVIIGLMANNLIPARAGELARAYVLGQRERISKTTSLGTIAVDRLFDGVTLIPMMLIVAAFAGNEASFDVPLLGDLNFEQLGVVMAVLFGVALAVLFWLALSSRGRSLLHNTIARMLPAPLQPRVEKLLDSFFEGLQALRNPIDLALAWLMSLSSWMLEATMYYIIARAFGIDEPYYVFLLLTAAANLAIAVIASQGGVGPFELVVSETVIAFGVLDPGKAQAYALGLHAILLFPIIALGLWLMWSMKLTFGDMLKASDLGEEPGTRTDPPAPSPPDAGQEPALPEERARPIVTPRVVKGSTPE